MERIASVNPSRLRWCLADRGVSAMECATELGIAPDRLSMALAGEPALSAIQLAKLAEYFGRGLLFFLDPDPIDERRVRSEQFRTLANQKPDLPHRIKALIERAERQRDVYLSLREDLEDTDLPRFVAPSLRAKDPTRAAAAAREWLGLGDRNDFDSYRFAIESKGVLVFRSNGYAGKWQIAKDSPILGLSLYHAECPVIVVKKMPSEAQQVFTLMHELGHLLLHRTGAIDDASDLHSSEGLERQANAFAGHLLVPDRFLAEIDDRLRPESVADFDHWLSEQRRAWGVSGEVILRRLLDAGRLSGAAYASYRRWRESLSASDEPGGSREWRHREPRHLFGDRYVRTVLDALSARQITLARASSHLDNLKVADLHKLERFYAGA